MKILMIHSLMFHHRSWKQAAERLISDQIELSFIQQSSAVACLDEKKQARFDLVIADLSRGMPGFDNILKLGRGIPERIGLSDECPDAFTTFSRDCAAEFKHYVEKESVANFVNGIRYLAAQTGLRVTYSPPAPVTTTGLYHPDAPGHFKNPGEYMSWFTGRLNPSGAPRIGILVYYSQLAEHNTNDVDALIRELEVQAMVPFCVFCEGAEGRSDGGSDAPPWLQYFREPPGVDLVLNLMAGRLLKTTRQTPLLQEMDVPIIQLLRSHSQTPEEWRHDSQGLPGMTAVYSLSQPELFGVTAPVIIAGSQPSEPDDPAHGWRTFIPIKERIHVLCRKILRWVRLRRLKNRDKRVAFVLHNNPCKGVESTVGMAVGLDAFESLSLVLKEMKSVGYDTGRAPHKGSDILKDIMDRKTVAEFRWTTVDEIVNKGGALHLMDAEEYLPWFEGLPAPVQNKVNEDWNHFPGQGMVYRSKGKDMLVISGIRYGNIRIMVQPKRGCYGSKCTGEVCRILHDPKLAPPHHWLATYKYIRENSDAVVHFGTEGALEFLPGKQVALGDTCFPEISIGDLPNLYVYVMDATGDGLVAKRRGQAVLVDHLTPVYRPTPLDDQITLLENLLNQYAKAETMGESGRLNLISRKIVPLIAECGLTEAPPDPDTLPGAIDTARRRIEKMKRSTMPEGLHRLSIPPDSSALSRMLAVILKNRIPGLPDIETISTWTGDTGKPVFERATTVLKRLITGAGVDTKDRRMDLLRDFCLDFSKRMARCSREIEHLLRGLDGRFIPPGLSGSLLKGRIDTLPTGCNFYATDVTTLPTPAAWKIGKRMTDTLLLKYLDQEKRFPESIGLNIWSSDAFKSDGELLCQAFWLLGVRPVWDEQGRVRETRTVDLEKLILTLPDGSRINRPRVDITVQTSSMMRDLVPGFCELLDRSVLTVSRLDEPEDLNFIRKHTMQQMKHLRDRTEEKLSDTRIRRLAALRIFSSAPGTYSMGVGLALDASAWQDTADLAEIYINQGGYAYTYDGEGVSEHGIPAQQILADQLSRIDVSYMKQSSDEYDILDCGCYASAQGGMAAAASAMGKKTRHYWGNSAIPEDADISNLSDEIRRSAKTRLLNPEWIRQMRRHGYQGAHAVAGRVNNMFKWSAVTGSVTKQLFDQVARTYIQDEKNRSWLQRDNPHALEEITRRLLEAYSRNLWAAEEDMLNAVQSAALEVEGDMEEMMGDVVEDFQGSKVEVLTDSDVENWNMEWKIGNRRSGTG